MKLLLTVFIILSSTGLLAEDLMIHVIDGWKSTPLVDCKVVLTNSTSETVKTNRTDTNGNAYFDLKSLEGFVVSIEDDSQRFHTNYPNVIYLTPSSYKVILYPTIFYESKMIQQEDSLTQIREHRDSIEQISLESLPNMPDSLVELLNQTIKETVRNNIIYPEISRELGDQGRVYVECIVESDGTITHVKLVRGVSPELDREAKRVIRSVQSLDFIPKDARYARMKLRYPIIFTLQ